MATNRVAIPFGGLPIPQNPGENTAMWAPFSNTSPAFAVNDVIYLCQIPNYCTLYDFVIDTPQLDSSTGLVLFVGDNITVPNGGVGSGGYFGAGNTVGRNAAQNVMRPNLGIVGSVHASVPKVYSILAANIPVANTALGAAAAGAPAGIWLTMTVQTAATTGTTTGVITGYVKYTYTPSTGTQTNPSL